MRTKALQFVVVILSARALVPVGAHLIARPNKIDMPQVQYFTAQAVYLGWSLPTGIVLISAIVASLVLTIVQRGRGAQFWLSLVAFVSITATMVIFFVWTQPANRATTNWTVVPDNWLSLRAQWEYSHAANAVLTFIALCAALASTLIEQREIHPQRPAPRSERTRTSASWCSNTGALARRREPAGIRWLWRSRGRPIRRLGVDGRRRPVRLRRGRRPLKPRQLSPVPFGEHRRENQLRRSARRWGW
jgi:hypothetical protein